MIKRKQIKNNQIIKKMKTRWIIWMN